VYQVNNSVIFRGKPIGPEEFIDRLVVTLGITTITEALKEDLLEDDTDLKKYVYKILRPYYPFTKK